MLSFTINIHFLNKYFGAALSQNYTKNFFTTLYIQKISENRLQTHKIITIHIFSHSEKNFSEITPQKFF